MRENKILLEAELKEVQQRSGLLKEILKECTDFSTINQILNEEEGNKASTISQKIPVSLKDLDSYDRESRVLKYWQDKCHQNQDDSSIKNLLENSPKNSDTLINIIKEGKIKDIDTHSKGSIIRYLNDVSRIDISQDLTDNFLNQANSSKLREQ